MSASRFLDHLVCELPSAAEVATGFRWYEVELESPAPPRRPKWIEGAEVIAATLVMDPAAIDAHLEAVLEAGGFSHVLFELTSRAHAERAIARASARGVKSILTMHLPPGRRTESELLDHLRAIEDCGPAIAKIAYEATSPSEIAIGLAVLERAKTIIAAPVSVTPMGTRWGRIAAAAAGSHLIFAPLHATPLRQSAGDMLRTLEALEPAEL